MSNPLVIHVFGAPLATLMQQMLAAGATLGDRSADAILVSVVGLADARTRAEQLDPGERRRAVFVGIDETLDAARPVVADSLAEFVETYRPLAVMSSAVTEWRPQLAGFIGRKDLADDVGSPIFQLATSPHYGAYMRCVGDSAGRFLARYVRAATADPTIDAYSDYLRARNRRGLEQRIDDTLLSVGAIAEAELWGAWCDGLTEWRLESGIWARRRVHLGPALPRAAEPGELWFDVCELSLMVHGGRAWLASAPVASWQMRGFIEASTRVPREVQVPPPYTPLDPDRLLGSPIATRLTAGEATLYAWWFGKTLPHLFDWQSATEILPPDAVDEMWRHSAAEWLSTKLDDDEAARVFVTPSTIHEDPSELDDESRMIAGEHTQRWDLGFRTAVLAQAGLLRAVSAWHFLPEDVRLESLLDRSTFA